MRNSLAHTTPEIKQTSKLKIFKGDLKLLALIIIIALVIRLVYVWVMTPDTIIFPDALQHDNIAKNLLKGKGFAIGTDTYQHNRAPGYPAFISLIYLIFGTNIMWVKLAQSLLNTLTILPVYGLALMIFDRRVALTASIMMAIYPFFIFFCGLILTEVLFMALLGSSLLFIYTGVQNDKSPFLTIGSLLMGLAVLTRASLLLFPAFITAWIILEKKNHIKKALSLCVLFFVILWFPIVPWAIRNYFVYHSFVPVAIGAGITLSDANNPGADGSSDYTKLSKLPSSLSPLERDRLYMAKALQFIQDNPGRFLQLTLIKFKRFWNIIPNFEEYRSKRFRLISILSYGPILLFGIFGIGFSFLKKKRIIFLLLPIIYYTGIHMIFPGSIRYRVPIMPFFIIISAYGFFEALYLLPFKRVVNVVVQK